MCLCSRISLRPWVGSTARAPESKSSSSCGTLRNTRGDMQRMGFKFPASTSSWKRKTWTCYLPCSRDSLSKTTWPYTRRTTGSWKARTTTRSKTTLSPWRCDAVRPAQPLGVSPSLCRRHWRRRKPIAQEWRPRPPPGLLGKCKLRNESTIDARLLRKMYFPKPVSLVGYEQSMARRIFSKPARF